MTVPVTVERNNYTGNGTTATYAYGFRITAQTHLKVTVADADGAETELAIGTDYTVTGVGVKTGGNIVLVDNGQAWIDGDGYLETGWDMSIRHFVPLTQSTDIRNQGTFYPEIHEDAFDYLMWVCKQQQDEINRSVKAGETVTGVTPVFPAPEDGKSLVWSGTSGAMVNSDLKGDTGATGATGPQGPAGADGVLVSRDTFTNASLSTGKLTVTHNLALAAPYSVVVKVFNNSSKEIIPDNITGATNSFEIDLTSYGTLTGTWGYSYMAG